MIGLGVKDLPAATAAALTQLQAEVLAAGSYRQQIEHGKALFSANNKASNPVFRVIRTELHMLAGATRRCVYCEDSIEDEVEHIAPKDLYPEKVFIWENYVGSCGPCNGSHKQSEWRIFPAAGGASVDVTRKKDTKKVSYLRILPVQGNPVFIDPRTEDPMHFLQLDLFGGTGLYTARPGISPLESERAEYTRDILGLNTRPGLAQGRKNAYTHLRECLVAYDRDKAAGASSNSVAQIQRAEAIKTTGHRTVWKEMIRQQNILQIDAVFARTPEALGW